MEKGFILLKFIFSEIATSSGDWLCFPFDNCTHFLFTKTDIFQFYIIYVINM